jgi:hypothetical protein
MSTTLSQIEIDVARALFSRSLAIIEDNSGVLSSNYLRCDENSLQNLCREAIDNTPKYPFDKLNRWIGFVQGILACHGLIKVDQERNFTRPLLHSLHDTPPPPTFETGKFSASDNPSKPSMDITP